MGSAKILSGRDSVCMKTARENESFGASPVTFGLLEFLKINQLFGETEFLRKKGIEREELGAFSKVRELFYYGQTKDEINAGAVKRTGIGVSEDGRYVIFSGGLPSAQYNRFLDFIKFNKTSKLRILNEKINKAFPNPDSVIFDLVKETFAIIEAKSQDGGGSAIERSAKYSTNSSVAEHFRKEMNLELPPLYLSVVNRKKQFNESVMETLYQAMCSLSYCMRKGIPTYKESDFSLSKEALEVARKNFCFIPPEYFLSAQTLEMRNERIYQEKIVPFLSQILHNISEN